MLLLTVFSRMPRNREGEIMMMMMMRHNTLQSFVLARHSVRCYRRGCLTNSLHTGREDYECTDRPEVVFWHHPSLLKSCGQ